MGLKVLSTTRRGNGGGNTTATIRHLVPLSRGTGKLTGASGFLTFDGVESLTTGAFTETITGTVCRSRDDHGRHDR